MDNQVPGGRTTRFLQPSLQPSLQLQIINEELVTPILLGMVVNIFAKDHDLTDLACWPDFLVARSSGDGFPDLCIGLAYNPV